MIQKLLIPIFSRVWKGWLGCDGLNARVIRVTGWRSAFIQLRSQRKHVRFCVFGLSVLALAALSVSLNAGDIITATVVLTNAANLNGTNGASLTLSSDYRIATNAVHSASTQWKASTNLLTARDYLLNHLISFPFSGVQASATNNGLILRGTEGAALSLTVSNSWASVAYRTQTVTSGSIVLRSPRTTEANLAERAKGDDDIVARMNNAPTNTVSETAASMAGFVNRTQSQSVSGNKTFTGADSFPNISLGASSLAVDNAVTNFWVDLISSANAYRLITATAAVNLQATTNRSSSFGRTVTVLIYPNGTNRNLSVNSSWHALSAVDAVLTNTTIGVLSITAVGSSETNVFYSYKAVP